jgi:hypothetical protein
MTAQARWDETFAKVDRSCPPQKADESETDYLRRLAIVGKKYIPKGEEIYQVTFRKDTADPLPDAYVERYSEMVRAAVERNIMRTDNMAPGEMRPVMQVDENTGAKHRLWIGPDSFVKAMGQPCRRADGLTRPDNISRLRAASFEFERQCAMMRGVPAYGARQATFGNSKGHGSYNLAPPPPGTPGT